MTEEVKKISTEQKSTDASDTAMLAVATITSPETLELVKNRCQREILLNLGNGSNPNYTYKEFVKCLINELKKEL